MYESSEQLRRKGFDQVYVELDRYDGPAAGLADVHGVPHYFHRDPDNDERFFVWPVDDVTLAPLAAGVQSAAPDQFRARTRISQPPRQTVTRSDACRCPVRASSGL